MKVVLALRHVAFEDLGSFHALFEAKGFAVHYVDPWAVDLTRLDALSPAIVAILGGPIGAYQDDLYPFVAHEVDFIRRRLAADLPILGICLGAQLIARALGARVYPASGLEIGWKALSVTATGRLTPAAHLDGERTSMLHWHGDTFDLPDGAELLASTESCVNQVFRKGATCMAFQCHPELDYRRIESWLVGHACELGKHGIDPRQLREDSAKHGPALTAQAGTFLDQWLRGLEDRLSIGGVKP